MAFKTISITADDCDHISKEEIAKVRQDWTGYPEFADSILGYGFLPMVQDAVINGKALEDNLANPPPAKMEGETHAFCDFAWSNAGDENVIALRRGNVITIEETFHCGHLVSNIRHPEPGIVELFIAGFNRLGLCAGQISGDEGGGGQLVMDVLDERGWILNRVNNGGTASDDEHYANIAAEIWFEGGKHITSKSFVLPNDQTLRGQLLNRKRVKHDKGKLKVESKEEMKKRGVPSPDRADACTPAGTMVRTIRGDVPIEEIRIGDLVLTPMGYSPVVKLHRRRADRLKALHLNNGKRLEITPNHKLFTREDGWVMADAILLTHSLESVNGVGLWKYLNSSFTRAENIGFKAMVDIIKTKTGTASPNDFFIESSGLSAMGQFLQGCASIIKMRTGRTIRKVIYRSLNVPNTATTTLQNFLEKILNGGEEPLLGRGRQFLRHLNGTGLKLEFSGIGNMRKSLSGSGFPIFRRRIAISAERNSRNDHLESTRSVPSHAGTKNTWKGIKKNDSARFASLLSLLNARPQPKLAVTRVEELQLSEPRPVYNLTLESENAYYANGVLVENCLGAMAPGGGYSNRTIHWALPIAAGRLWTPTY